MKSAARQTPDNSASRAGEAPHTAGTSEESAIDEHSATPEESGTQGEYSTPRGEETPGEQTISFRPIQDDDRAPSPSVTPDAEAVADGTDAVADDAEEDDGGPNAADTDETDTDETEIDGAEDGSSENDRSEGERPERAQPQEDGQEDDRSEDDRSEEVQPSRRRREMPLPEPVSAALTEALNQLLVAVKGLHFGLDVPGSDEARKAQAAVLAQLEDYVIPRVHLSTAPALVVVAGSTGAGKSTLVNTLAAQKVTATGVRRPTTATPVLACHPDDHEWYATGDLLSGMIRVRRQDGEAGSAKDAGQAKDGRPDGGAGRDSVVLVPTPRLPQDVALLDTPDIDSVVEEHHGIAHRMLDVADLWMFVTTAARYADAPSWGLLRRAKERGARLVIVLSRVPAKSRDVIVKHFGRMLDEYGLGEAERFVINESVVRDGRLPEAEVAELRMWLAELSVDDQRRVAAVQATLNGVLDSFRTRLPALARHLETQVALRADLRSDVDAAYAGALTEIDEATRNGSLLRGEVLARWQDFAGSGDLMRTLQMRRGGKGRQQSPERIPTLRSALRTALESMIISAAQRAAEDVAARWGHRAGAGDRLAAVPGLGRHSDELVRKTTGTITAWQDHVTELIRTEGVTKRSVAKIISFDVESLALIFTVGLLGYGTTDMSAAGAGTSALPQRLLRGLLGAESLRSIGAKARSDLRARIGLLFDEEMLRYVDVLDSAGIPDEAAATRLYQATYNLEVAR